MVITGGEERLAELRSRLSSLSWFMRYLAEGIARQANSEDECTGRFWEGRYKCQPLLDESVIVACIEYVDLNPIRAGLHQTPDTSRFTSIFERLMAQAPQAELAETGESVAVAPRPADQHEIATETVSTPAERPRNHWLSPIELAPTDVAEEKVAEASSHCGRASSRGCMPLSATQYYELLDWTGRQFRADKCGIIPAELAPILERLSVHTDSWMRLVKSFRQLFRQAAGRPASLAKEATRRGQHWLQGTSTSHSLFGPSATF